MTNAEFLLIPSSSFYKPPLCDLGNLVWGPSHSYRARGLDFERGGHFTGSSEAVIIVIIIAIIITIVNITAMTIIIIIAIISCKYTGFFSGQGVSDPKIRSYTSPA